MKRPTILRPCWLALVALFTGAFPGAAGAGSVAPPPVPSDTEIRKILVERIDTSRQGVGIVVGVIEPRGRRIIAYGHLAKDDPRPLDGGTLFEIGSVTKVFTSLLLADMVQRGEVKLTDPVEGFLPKGVKVPQRNGKSITLVDLSNQTSGLPRLPDNLAPTDPANPYADYSPELLYRFLSTHQLARDIGAKFEYSNLGVGLLGHALARRAGMDFERLVRERIGVPLGMRNTLVTLTPDQRTRLAVGHDRERTPVPAWDIPTLAGAGALRSSADDLLAFLAANLGYAPSKLAPAMAAMVATRRPAGAAGMEIGLGWLIATKDGSEIVWHNGGTGGYRSFLGFNPKTRVGVVVLSNTSTQAGVDDIGMHLLDPRRPLIPPPTEHQEIVLDPKRLEGLPGQYQLAPGFTLTITREGDGLFAQATGQSRFRLFPEGERKFFFKEVEAQVTFDAEVQGKASGLVLHQNGQNLPAPRLAGEAPPPKVHREIRIEPKLFDLYLGRYALTPDFVLAITREGDHLYAQATGQPRFEIFPEGNADFFFKVVDAQISFQTDAQGRATGLTLHQGGAHQPARRMD